MQIFDWHSHHLKIATNSNVFIEKRISLNICFFPIWDHHLSHAWNRIIVWKAKINILFVRNGKFYIIFPLNSLKRTHANAQHFSLEFEWFPNLVDICKDLSVNKNTKNTDNLLVTTINWRPLSTNIFPIKYRIYWIFKKCSEHRHWWSRNVIDFYLIFSSFRIFFFSNFFRLKSKFLVEDKNKKSFIR